jgi:hypothetical protein
MTDEQLAVADHEDLVVEIRRLREENELLKHDKLMEEGINVALRKKIVKLRKVVDAAREALPWLEPIGDGRRYTAAIYYALKQALHELDKGER